MAEENEIRQISNQSALNRYSYPSIKNGAEFNMTPILEDVINKNEEMVSSEVLLERQHAINKITSQLVANAIENNLPVLLLKHGSSVYKEGGARDLDAYIIIEANELQKRGLEQVVNSLYLPMGPLSTWEKDTEDLIEQRVVALGYDFTLGHLPLDLKIATVETVRESLSPIGYHGDVERRYAQYYGGKDLKARVRGIKGDLYEIPDYTPPISAGQNYVDVLGPGALYDNNASAPTKPVFYEYFLTSEVLFDGTNTQFREVLEEKTWRTITRQILFANKLYDENMRPADEAYNEKYILQLLFRRDRFSPSYKEALRKKYFEQLDRIREMQTRKTLVSVA